MEDTFSNMMSRKKALEKTIERLEKRLSRDRSEYEELCTALEVMARYGLQVDESSHDAQDGVPTTIGDMALEVLKAHPAGLTASDILSEIQGRWKPDLVRTSLSPPLSRLKEKEEIEYIEDNSMWRIPKNNKEGPSVDAPEPSNNIEQGDELEDEIPF